MELSSSTRCEKIEQEVREIKERRQQHSRALQERVGNSESDQQRASQLEKDLAQKTQECEKTVQQLHETRNQIEQQNQQLEQHNGQIQQLERRIQQLEQRNEQLERLEAQTRNQATREEERA